MQQQKQPPQNTLIFFLLATLFLLGWSMLSRQLWPPKPPAEPEPPPAEVATVKTLKPDDAVAALIGALGAPDADNIFGRTTQAAVAVRNWAGFGARPAVAEEKPAIPDQPRRQITMGNEGSFLRVTVDSEGASVRSVTLPAFQQADNMGRPVWLDEARTQKKPLELVQEHLNEVEGSNVLYDCKDAKDERPLARLGKRNWQIVEPQEIKPGESANKVVFRTVADGVEITKIYTLEPGDYHIGLKVELKNLTGQPRKFRYHLTSGHGLPIEGEWYTTNFRNGVVGRVNSSNQAYRTLQTLRDITRKAGGDEVLGDGMAIQYGGVTVQYFSSLVVLAEQHIQDFTGKKAEPILVRARPTLMTAVLRGKVNAKASDGKSFDLLTSEVDKHTIHATAAEVSALRMNERVAVVYRTDEFDRAQALTIYTGEDANNNMLFDDINVHLVSDAIELKPGAEPVVHDYLLYNGPVKVRLLGQLRDVDPALIDRYEHTLHLNSVTDYPGTWWGSDFFSAIGWTWLLIWCTNLMHSVLWTLHTYVMPWSYGLCIILLTFMVRAAMFPLSRKQQLTSLKMQSLAPELKKLQEKYKDDRQALGVAQMELYRKHGVNPLGSCWVVLLQMPIFLGLYYALQESIHFRLAPFLWIQNLAAPDMLLWWSESIPFISRPQDYGTFFYLGPFFNLLPIIAVAFMLVQQQMLTPPPTDEQQQMQQRMMKFMTIFFGLMFFKFAAGLCTYFIVSSLWGFTERKLLLPKWKPDRPPEDDRNGLVQRALDRLSSLTGRTDTAATAMTTSTPPVTTAAPEAPGRRKTKKQRRQERNRRRGEGTSAGPTAAPPSTSDGWWAGKLRQARAWWTDILRKAEKR
jgi:YidC/Oxa1 family membrane protein insertase